MLLYHEPQRGGWTLKLAGRHYIGLSAIAVLAVVRAIAPDLETYATSILYPD